jgi:hypothetical protein
MAGTEGQAAARDGHLASGIGRLLGAGRAVGGARDAAVVDDAGRPTPARPLRFRGGLSSAIDRLPVAVPTRLSVNRHYALNTPATRSHNATTQSSLRILIPTPAPAPSTHAAPPQCLPRPRPRKTTTTCAASRAQRRPLRRPCPPAGLSGRPASATATAPSAPMPPPPRETPTSPSRPPTRRSWSSSAMVAAARRVC